MPFVPKEHREPSHQPCCVGDMCYVEYKKLIYQFRENRRWTNAHNMTKEFFGLDSDEKTARFLAWMVWFSLEVIPYEIEKRDENGNI
jgi:hypothetical protein